MLPRENFRIFGLPWPLHFARFHGGERECRVVKRKSQSQAIDLLKI